MVCWFKSKSLDSKKPTRYFPFIIHMLITLRTVFSMLLQSMLIVFPHLNHVIILILMILLFRDITFS